MECYDDELPARKFDNFQFVDFNKVRRCPRGVSDTMEAMEARFALHALMELPDQYPFIKQAGLLDPARFPHHFKTPPSLAISPHSQFAPQQTQSSEERRGLHLSSGVTPDASPQIVPPPPLTDSSLLSPVLQPPKGHGDWPEPPSYESMPITPIPITQVGHVAPAAPW